MDATAQTRARRVVYLAHGGEKYTVQAVYSIYSLLHWIMQERRQDVQVLVYTDDVDRIPRCESVLVKPLSEEALHAYKGEHGYVHRVKLAILADAQRDCHGPIIFADCDTKWIRSPSSAFEALEKTPTLCFMHELEGNVSESNHPSYFKALESGFMFQERFEIAPPWTMWNSGAIGLPKEGQLFFDDALAVTDELLAGTENRNWVEQLAVSLLATSRFNVRSLDDYLVHFWRDSFALPSVIARVLPRLGEDVQENARICKEFPIEEELLKYRTSARGQVHKRIHKAKQSWRKRTTLRKAAAR